MLKRIRPRAESLDVLDFYCENGQPRHVGKFRIFPLTKAYMKVRGGEAIYTDEELELLARLSERIDQKALNLRRESDAGGYGFLNENPYEIQKEDLRNGSVFWLWSRPTWRCNIGKLDLPRLLSEIYRGLLFEPGFYGCTEEMTPMRLETQPNKIFLCAPAEEELGELIELYQQHKHKAR